MPSLSQIFPYILAALIAVGALFPGLEAVQQSIETVKAGKKKTNTELCYAKVEGLKPRDADERLELQNDCKSKADAATDAAYATAINYIVCFKELITLTSGSTATSDAIATSAATCTK